MWIQVGYIDGKELTLACQKEHKALEINCEDHRNLDLKSNEKATSASVYNMSVKGYTLPISFTKLAKKLLARMMQQTMQISVNLK